MSIDSLIVYLSNSKFAGKIARKFPVLKKIKRNLLAWKDSSLPVKKTYSQFREDLIILELLPDLSSSDVIYIEVGANQPTQLSNTYLFYRMGFRGIVIEPNHDLSQLFRQFRPEDIHLEIGCSDKSGIGKFKFSDASVLSGFTEDIKSSSNSYSWVPLLTVDQLWHDAGGNKKVFLLSIDTEGFDLKVSIRRTTGLHQSDPRLSCHV